MFKDSRYKSWWELETQFNMKQKKKKEIDVLE